jgi:hypothetical protein
VPLTVAEQCAQFSADDDSRRRVADMTIESAAVITVNPR